MEFLGEARIEAVAEFTLCDETFTLCDETGLKPLTTSILFNGEFLLYS